MTIAELARSVAGVVGFAENVTTDPSKPDGTLRKLMSGDKIAAMGWHPRVTLEDGLAATYADFLITQR